MMEGKYKFTLYDGEKVCSIVTADYDKKTVTAEDLVSDPVKTAFGNNKSPGWTDFERFLEDRCIPRARAGLREYLEAIGLDEYSTFDIIQKTKGRMAEDCQWIETQRL